MITGVPAASPGSPTRPRRPPPVTFLAAVQLLSAVAYGLVFLALLADGSAVVDQVIASVGAATGHASDLAVAAVTSLVAAYFVAALAAGLLMLRMRQLGWTITMLLAGLGLASSVYLWFAQGTTLEIWVAVQVVTVFYLNQRQVREAFGISHRRAGDALDRARE